MTLQVFPWRCPFCEGTGNWGDAGRCLHCAGRGLTDDVGGWDPEELVAAPRPPGVMRTPCADCAYRPGAPEQDTPEILPTGEPFFCHKGLADVNGAYQPTMIWQTGPGRGIPVGALVCAGWWNQQLGQAPPERPFREPKDRSKSVGGCGFGA